MEPLVALHKARTRNRWATRSEHRNTDNRSKAKKRTSDGREQTEEIVEKQEMKEELPSHLRDKAYFADVSIQECTEVFEIEVSHDITPNEFSLDGPDLANVDSVDPKRMSESGYMSTMAVEMLWGQKNRLVSVLQASHIQDGHYFRYTPRRGLLQVARFFVAPRHQRQQQV